MKRPNTIADFWLKVDIRGPDECWEWREGRSRYGYGVFRWKGAQLAAHRFAWIATNGDIPPGLVIRHTCDNKACCNPAHLLLGTQADNIHDMYERGREAKGSRNGNAILTEDDVMEIWRLLSERKTQTEIAAMYGVDRVTITSIATGRNWAWLTGKESV